MTGGLFPASAAANENALQPTEMEAIVVTARGTACPVSLTPGGVGLVSAEEIGQAVPVSLTDIVRHIPGVEKTTDSPWGSDINIRGLSRNSVVFLVDGCRVNTATDINGRFGLINPYDIERIEVLKGPISVLYGSGSMGGVVNVITKKGRYSEEPRKKSEVVSSVSTNPRGADIYADSAYENSQIRIFASAGYRDHDDRIAADRETVNNSRFRDDYAKISTGFRWNDGNETAFDLQHMQGYDIGIPGKGLSLPEGPDVTYPRISRILCSLTHTLTPDNSALSESRINLYLQEVQRRVRLDDFPKASPTDSLEPAADHRTIGLKWINRITLEHHDLVMGMDLWQWQVNNTDRYQYLKNGQTSVDSSLGNVSQVDGGLFAEDSWSLADHRVVVNIGGRLDVSHVKSDDLYDWIIPPPSIQTLTLKRNGQSDDDMSWQGHAGVTWQFGEQWSATAIAASGYRPPDLMDRFKYINLSGGMTLFGNPELKPERSCFFETGIHFDASRFWFSASVYADYLTDLITEAAVSNTVLRMENVDRAEIFGTEMSVKWQIAESWTLQADAAWSDGRNKTSDEPLPYIAPLNGRFSIRYGAANGLWAEINSEWAAAQTRTPDDQKSAESWQTINLYAGYRFRAFDTDHTLNVGVSNLLDKDYRNYLSTSRGIELREPGINASFLWKVQF